MKGQDSLMLAPGPRRYPLFLAVGWLLACSAVDAASGSALRAEPFYLPAILFAAWYYSRLHGLVLAWLGATLAGVAEFTAGPRPEFHVLYWNFIANGALFSLVAWLMGELRAHQRRVDGLLTTDAASGFLNRPGLLAKLSEELVRTERFGGDTSLVCIGLNGLPRFVADRGVEQAETMLRDVFAALRVAARRTDVVARLDDDEFAVLLRGTGSAAAASVADKLGRSLTEHLLTRGIDLSCSVGVTSLPLGRVLDGPALLAQALARMYEHRSSGARPRHDQSKNPSVASLCQSPAVTAPTVVPIAVRSAAGNEPPRN